MSEYRMWDVRDFGALGDGSTLDTAAIQHAVNDCAACGGGTVYFPAGVYLSGTLHLKSNITLNISASATLLGSPRKEDYNEAVDCNSSTCGEHNIGSGYFLVAENIENFAITGQGKIDGSGPAFWEDEPINTIWNFGPIMKPKPFRPRSLLYMTDCRNISLTDITFCNSPCYTVWLLGCEIINIDRVSIINPLEGPNTDAFDIDCCSDVHISNCYVSAGDDAIALKSDANRLGRRKACENITVTNCTFLSKACGIRIGYEGDTPIRNCTFSNIVMRNTDIGISMVSVLPNIPRPKPGTKHTECLRIDTGCQIEGIIFSNIIMENVNRAAHLWLGAEVPGDHQGYIRNVSISDVIASVNSTLYVGGMADRAVEGVTLSNIKLLIKGNMEGIEKSTDPYNTCVWGGDRLPIGVYLRNTKNMKLKNIEVCWEESACGNWTNTVRAEESAGLEVDGLRCGAFESSSDIPAVDLMNIDTAFIHSCTSLPGTNIYLGVRGDKSRNITLIGNDLHEAKQPVVLDGLPDEIVFLEANRVC